MSISDDTTALQGIDDDDDDDDDEDDEGMFRMDEEVRKGRQAWKPPGATV